MTLFIQYTLNIVADTNIKFLWRLLLDTGSSNISAEEWDMWSKFGMPTALNLPAYQKWPS